MDKFEIHGVYTISNHGGYEIMISDCNEKAKVKDAYGNHNPQISEWLPIGLVYDIDVEDWIPVIDPKGYHIPLHSIISI